MAGRSGAAAIAVALREAGESFSAQKLAAKCRAANPTLAAALELLKDKQPAMKVDEAECYLMFAAGEVAQSIEAADGTSVDLLADGTIRGVSLYME